MGTIAANELKTRGVATIREHLAREPEAIITVRGQNRYVIMEMEHYKYLRECELEAAVQEARADLEAGRVKVESVDDHIRRLTQSDEV